MIRQDVIFKTDFKVRALRTPNSGLLSQRALDLKPSLTLEISSKAKSLIKEGRDICSLSAGEPDFETPSFIVEAAIKALKDGITKYGPAAGDPDLRNALANKISIENKIAISQENILVTNGGKQAIYNLLQVILNSGDEVLIPSPYWLSYPEIVRLAGAKPVIVRSEISNSFKIDFDEMDSLVNQNTKLLIINSPNNPTGSVLSIEDLKNIVNFLRKNEKIFLLSDEIYEYLLSDGVKHNSIISLAPELKDRIFTVNGFAKGWAMTGWRVGYLSGQKKVIEKATALQSQSTSNVCSFAQRGALAAITGSKSCLKEMATTFTKRRNLLSNGLKEIKGISLIEPKGAFYAFPKIDKEKILSIEFCNMALEKVGLSIVPGLAFGEDHCVRISCAASEDTIKDGLKRLKMLMNSI